MTPRLRSLPPPPSQSRWAGRLLFTALLMAPVLAAGVAPPETMLQQIQQDQSARAKLNQDREARFAREKAAASAQLSQAQKSLQVLKLRSNGLKAQFESNQKQIAQLQGEQSIEADDASELPRALRLAAGNLKILLAQSWINAQYPGREQLLARMADEKAVPGTRDLEQLWQVLDAQLRESGRVARFTADVHEGEDVRKRPVIRVGEFAAVTENGHFLLYEPTVGLSETAHQPGWRWRRLARRFADAEQGLAGMAVDPGAGTVLRKIAQQPDVFGRIVKILLLFVLFMLAGAQLRRLWAPPPRRRIAAGGALAGALEVYDSRFNVALLVSLWHLAFLLWLLQSLFAGSEATAELATAQDVFQIVPIEAPPAANVEQAAASGAPSPPPPVPAPTLSIPAPQSTVKAPPVDVAMPSIDIPMQVQSGGALFGGQFAGFAGSAGTGRGAGGAGTGTGGGGTGKGYGGGGKPIIPLSTARPQISDYAFNNGIEGWVVVAFTVGVEGRVKNIRILDADPKGIFEAAAVESMSHWIYPRLDHDVELIQRVEFKLEDHQFNWDR